MKQIISLGGRVVVENIPAPICGDDNILVSNLYSLISAGTETTTISSGSEGMASKIIKNPELINKGIALVRREGLSKSLEIIKGQQSHPLPLGYSSSGIVIEVGKNISDMAVGDRVACAGAGYANHAELVSVPRNLTVKIPENVDFNEASFTTVGSIAMQGIRRANIQFGDNVVVIGLGLLGLIACQILKASGAHVIGIDMIQDRIRLAKDLGVDHCFVSNENTIKEVLKYTDGYGADSVLIYAATKSTQPVKDAIKMARKKGNIVVIGDVGMEIDRSPFYEKELDFLISCSYGPGRYDPLYEEKGFDYPLGYVRWTENRNMQEFLKMVSENKINLMKIIDCEFPLEKANEAYEFLQSEKKPIGVLFKYEKSVNQPIIRKVKIVSREKQKDIINVAVIGAGNFAQTFHLPNIKKIPQYNLKAVVARTGLKAKGIATKFGAEYFTTDYKDVFQDETVDLVLISTRHNLHAPLILEAANNNQDIFVEKPMAMGYDDCKKVYNAVIENNVNLVVDFNRRLSPLAQKAKKLIENRKNPLIITYRVNSAGMNKDHWINDPIEGGGAIIGEGCHFFDFCNWIVGKNPDRIYAEMISSDDSNIVDTNNMISTIKYLDGSIATVIYSTIGSESFSKERIEIFCDGGVISIIDFNEIIISEFPSNSVKLDKIDKGHFNLLFKYGNLLLGKDTEKDIPAITDGVNATICSLKVLDALKTGQIQNFDFYK